MSPSVDNVFDSDVDDAIPTLPKKYQDIILADDWYIPGKAQRKKRVHRKSHGKIGFSGKLLLLSETFNCLCKHKTTLIYSCF